MKHVKTFLSGCGFFSKAVCSTILICSKQIFDGGFLCIAGGYFVQIVQFVLLTFIWKALEKDQCSAVKHFFGSADDLYSDVYCIASGN